MLIPLGGLLAACSDMNEMHDMYLRDGEITYVGRVDSVRILSGRERVKLFYWLTDPRVKRLQLFWNQKRDSLQVAVPEHEPLDALDVTIGDGNGVIAEGNHTFLIYSHDERGHRSVVFETLVNIYGEQYQARLLQRRVIETKVADNNDITVLWGGSSSADEIGIALTYTDNNGVVHNDFYPNVGSETLLPNVDPTKGITYQTLYMPEPTAIDTFRTELQKVPVVKITNVALGKPVTASDILTPTEPTQQPANAVDGLTAYTTTRWVSTAAGEHWLEIDLQGEYTVSSFKTWNGQGSGYSNPITRMKLQAWLNGEWVDVHEVNNNSDTQYGASFNPVTTTKVRLYCYSQVRLFEIAVYSIITY